MEIVVNTLILANVSEKLREFLKNDKYEEKLKTAYKREVEYQRKIYSTGSKAFYDANIDNDMVILAVSYLELNKEDKTLATSNFYAISYLDKNGELIKDDEGLYHIIEIRDFGEIIDMKGYDKWRHTINPESSDDQYKYVLGSFFYACIKDLLEGTEMKDLYTYSDFVKRYNIERDVAIRMEKDLSSKTMRDIFAKLVDLRDKRNKYSYVFDIFTVPLDEWVEAATAKKEELLSEKYRDYYVTVSITNDGVHNSSLAMGIDRKNKEIAEKNPEINDIVKRYSLEFFEYFLKFECMDGIFIDFADIAWKYQDKLRKGSTDIRRDTPDKGKTNFNDMCFAYEGNLSVNSNDIEDVYKIVTEDEKRRLGSDIELIKSIFDMRKVGVF
jgi:hypothetical protein